MDLLTVTSAKHTTGYKLRLSFNNGEEREVDLSAKLDKPVFKPLKNIEYFKKFKLNPFTIEWGSGADFSPKYLYDLATHQEEKTTNTMYE